MSSDIHGNPFKRGKGLLLSSLILEGKSNKEIKDYYIGMGFDKKYGVMNDSYLYQVRCALKKDGLLDSGGFVIKKQIVTSSESAKIQENNKVEGENENMNNEVGEGKKENILSIMRHPDWDLLSNEQINSIGDPKLKMEILNYRTEITKLKQDLKPEFATRGEIDLLRTEVVGRVGGIEEKINLLLKKLEEPEQEDPKEEEEGSEEAINPSVVSTGNPLSGQEAGEKPRSRAGESLIEVEKGVIVTKLIGFTTKSLMWYELDKVEGLLPSGEAFPGNLADYVNSCIEDVHVSRNIGLSLTQRRAVK